MLRKKNIPAIIALMLFVFFTVDAVMINFGTKKYYEVKEKNSIVQDSLTEGLIAYRGTGAGVIFFKWNIISIKEIKNERKIN